MAGGPPEHIKKFLNDELWTWKSLNWWKNHLEKSGGEVSVDVADTLPNGCELWIRSDTALIEAGKNRWPDEREYFRVDGGEYIGLIRLVVTKK